MSSPAPRGSWMSLLGWLAPVGLIVGGLAFLAADVTDDGSDIVGSTPANATEAMRAHADAFVSQHASPGASAAVAGLVPVRAIPDGPSVYHVRLVVVSHESRADAPRTVAFCVQWDIDVSTGAVAEIGAVELSTDRGTHPADRRADEWRERCAAELGL